MRFTDLVGLNKPPAEPVAAVRRPICADSPANMSGDLANNGFVSGLVDHRRARRLGTSRRGFLRAGLTTAAATAAASVTGLFGPARRVEAQTGVIGQYPRRLLTFCPPYNSNDNCQPGCGSSPICTDCCTSDGYFRNDPANGYSLYAGGCGDGDIADGWLWRYNGVCGSCASIEYRCSDGYIQTDTGPAPFICRAVTACDPLPDGAATNDEPDLAVDTNWRPAGALEQAVDNGGSVTLRGWIADATGQPVNMRITSNNQIIHIGQAALSRPDIANAVRGAGANTGYEVTFPVEPGAYRLCVNALRGAFSVTIGCVELTAGSGQVVSGGRLDNPIGGTSSPAPDPTSAPTQPTATPAPAPPPGDEPTSEATAPPPTPAVPTPAAASAPAPSGETSPHKTQGAVEVLRRRDATTGFVSGWAADVDTVEAPWVEILVDGVVIETVRPSLPRPDVAASFASLTESAGFATSIELPPDETDVAVALIDPDSGERHVVAMRRLGAAIDADDETSPKQPPSATGEAMPANDTRWGAIDEAVVVGGDIVVRGWAVAPNDPDATVDVELIMDGARASTAASLTHNGVNDRYGIAGDHGFETTIPALRGTRTLRLETRGDAGIRVLDEVTIDVP